MYEHPVRLTNEEGLERSRLTVFFRLLLALPHIVWFGFWSVGVLVVAIVSWLQSSTTIGSVWSQKSKTQAAKS